MKLMPKWQTEIVLARIMVYVEWAHFITTSILAVYLSWKYWNQLEIYFSKSHPFYPVFMAVLVLFIMERCISFGVSILLISAVYKKVFHHCDNWFSIQQFMLHVTLAFAMVNLFYAMMTHNASTLLASVIVVVYRIFSLKMMLDFMKILQMEDPSLIQ